MGKPVGKNVRISRFRRLVTDLMYFSAKVPSVIVERRMDLSRVADARHRCSMQPSWSAIFLKAYATAARKVPELRQSYLNFPWPRLYEHPHNVVSLMIDRNIPGERIVLYCLIRSPENRSLEEIDAIIRCHKETPVEELRSYQRAVMTSRIPWPFRRFFWWASLNVFGRRRCHNFGTFSQSSIASQGAGIVQMIPLLTSNVHYGMFDDNYCLDVRLSWDHRILDGATIAGVLVDMEDILKNQIAGEIEARTVAKAA